MTRTLPLSLFLLAFAPACTIIEKDLLDTVTSEASAGEPSTGAEATSGTTAPTGDDDTTGLTGGDAGDSTTGDDAGDSTTGDGTTGTTESDLQLISPDAAPMCMPLCVNDEQRETPVLNADCALFVVDLAAQTETPIVPCDELNFAWIVPAGAPRCFAELVDRDNQTPGTHDQLSAECSELGLNLELLIVGEPVPAELFVGAQCEPSDNLQLDCGDL